jgi:hypothetical protein
LYPFRDVGTQYGNADGLQPRTLEIWQSYGMLDKISPKAAAMHAMVGTQSLSPSSDALSDRQFYSGRSPMSGTQTVKDSYALPLLAILS